MIRLATLAAVAFAVVASCEDSGAPPEADDPAAFSGRVTRVVDGDTFWLDTQPVSIRVFGLDAPRPPFDDGVPGPAVSEVQLAPPPQGGQDHSLMVQALVVRQVLVRGKVHCSAERGVVLMGNHRLSFDDHLVACSKCGADGCEHDDDGP